MPELTSPLSESTSPLSGQRSSEATSPLSEFLSGQHASQRTSPLSGQHASQRTSPLSGQHTSLTGLNSLLSDQYVSEALPFKWALCL